MRKISHNWNKKNMDRCARTFMDEITWQYDCLANSKDRKEKVYQLIEQYSKIEISVGRGLNYYEKG